MSKFVKKKNQKQYFLNWITYNNIVRLSFVRDNLLADMIIMFDNRNETQLCPTHCYDQYRASQSFWFTLKSVLKQGSAIDQRYQYW